MTKLTLEEYNNVLNMLKASDEDVSVAARILINLETPLPIVQLLVKRCTGKKRTYIINELCDNSQFKFDNFMDTELTFDSIKYEIMNSEDFINDEFIRQIFDIEVTSFVEELLKTFNHSIDGVTIKTSWNVTDNS